MNRFKLSLLALPIVAAAFVAGPFTSSRAVAQDEKKEGTKEVKELDTPLAKQMEIMEDGMKKLRRTLRKAESNKESLELIEKVEKAAKASKDMVPAKAGKIPEAERAKFVEAYKKDMEATIKTIGEMKTAVQEGKNDKAQELYKTIKTQEDKGHEKYTE
jgi:soluble cytochrome b562